jgi:hypothetical protein
MQVLISICNYKKAIASANALNVLECAIATQEF